MSYMQETLQKVETEFPLHTRTIVVWKSDKGETLLIILSLIATPAEKIL